MVNIVVHAWQGIAMHRLSGFADVAAICITAVCIRFYIFFSF
jgi:hypothetical protein